MFLKIDDTINFSNGIVYSNNPKIKINSPIDATIKSIKIKEGQEVKKGDTLIVLQNKKIETQYKVSNLEINTTEKEIMILKKMILKADEEKEIYRNQITIKSNMYGINRKSAISEIYSWEEQLQLSENKFLSSKKKFFADSILYSKKIISRIEFERSKRTIFEKEKKLTRDRFLFKKKKYELENLSNEKSENVKKIEKKLLNLERDIDDFKLKIKQLESNVKNIKYDQEYITEKKDKLIILSPINGTIPFLFNTKYNLRNIKKETPLVIIAPKKETFYAKINLADKDLLYLKKGQKVQLKFDAYTYYKYGGLQGVVNYISPSAIENNFYCIVDFTSENSNINLRPDYTIRGDIIIDKLRFYEYILKKIVKKI